MGINYSCKTKAKASLKLFNQISSFLFEQEYDEFTPHSGRDVQQFLKLNDVLKLHLRFNELRPSLRLNLFKNIKKMLPEDIDLSLWQVKDIEWVKDCPVPKGEDFRRLPTLWT